MPWEMSTYAARVLDEELTFDETLETKTIDGVSKVRCPDCNHFVQPFVMIDVRDWPVGFTGGVKWLCDGCLTKYERQGVEAGSGIPFSEETMYTWAGAPEEVLSVVTTRISNRISRYSNSHGASVSGRLRKHNHGAGLVIRADSPGTDIAAKVIARALQSIFGFGG